MKIRKGTRHDINRVLKMSGEFIEEYRKSVKMETDVSINTALKFKKKILEKDLKSGHGAIFIVEENKNFIGYIFVLTFTPEMESCKKYSPGYISDLHICKKYRRRGLGVMLIKEAERWLRVKKKEKVSLDVSIFNKKAIHLYKKLKFKDKSIKLEKKL